MKFIKNNQNFIPKKLIDKRFIMLFLSFSMVLFALIWFRINYSDQKIVLPFKINKNANFQISSPESVHLSQVFKVIISLDTNNSSVNAIGLNINYEGDNLRVVSIDTTQSFCQFYPEKKYNDNTGKINLSCGSPSPGFSGENNVLIIEFKSIKLGDTPIIIDPQSKILLSNGKGTNALSEFPQTSIKIINSL